VERSVCHRPSKGRGNSLGEMQYKAAKRYQEKYKLQRPRELGKAKDVCRRGRNRSLAWVKLLSGHFSVNVPFKRNLESVADTLHLGGEKQGEQNTKCDL